MDKEKLMTEEEWLAKYNASQKKSKKKSIRKWVRNGVALGLVAVLSVAGTLALLQKNADPKTNTFKGSSGLSLILTETKWDWNNDNTADTDEPMKDAQEYELSTEYAKNPQLVNVDSFDKLNLNDSNHTIESYKDTAISKYDEYVAMRIDFKGASSAVTYNDILSVIEPIQFDTTNWQLVKAYTTTWKDVDNDDIEDTGTNHDDVLGAKCLIFLYKTDTGYTTLGKKSATSALYSSIKTKATIPSSLGGNDSATASFPEFSLIMSGAAVDKDGYNGKSESDITNKLLELLNTAP